MAETRWESYSHSYRLESALIGRTAHVRIWQHNENAMMGAPDTVIIEAEGYDVVQAQNKALQMLAERLTPMAARES